MSKAPIVLIHGLWLHRSSWEPWIAFFAEHGYDAINPAWPGDSETTEATREHPELTADHGVLEIADSYAAIIATLPAPPIVIGHSFGGLLAQELLCRGIAAAAIALDPAPIKGVWQLPFSSLKASFPALGNPTNLTKAVALTFDEFHYGFTNALSEEEGHDLYDRYAIPSPARPLFQAATATFNPHSETKVAVDNATRGPLLITAGELDHTVPPVLSEAAFELYRHSPALTEYKLFSGRGHSLTIDHGWKEIAEYSLEWLNKNGL